MTNKIFFSLIIFTQFLFAQQDNIQNKKVIYTGTVLDQETKEHIAFATLFIEDQGVYQFCEEDGSFMLSLSLSPKSMVIVSAMGYEELQLPLKKVQGNIRLKPQIEELSEVVVIAEKQVTPLEVLKEVIKQKKDNYPTQPFNQQRHTKVTVAEQDAVTLDFEVINDEYHDGYDKLLAATQKVEQVKWNLGDFESSIFKNTFDINGKGRPNQVQYAPFLRKGKYKDFNYQFVRTGDIADDSLYIIDYQPPNFKWKYTHFDHSIFHSRAKIQSFRGRIFIRKSDFKVLKVEEEYMATGAPAVNKVIGIAFKEKSRSTDSLWIASKRERVYDVVDYKISTKEVFEYMIEKDGLNFASSYLKVQKTDYTAINGERYNGNVTSKSTYLDARTKSVTEYPWEGFNNGTEYTSLNRVVYDPIFWKQFKKDHPDL